MDVLVAGGHGRVGRRLLKSLAGQGHRARGLIRDSAHAPDLRAIGAVPVIGDIEADESLSAYVKGADAVVFAAGAGSGPDATDERRRSVDLAGATKLADAAIDQGVRRYVMLSSVFAEAPQEAPEYLRTYLEAKAEADAYLAASGLDWTIVRAGGLTDEPGTGLVQVTRDLGHRAFVPRDDVAAVLFACLTTRSADTVGVTFELLAGLTPIDDALRFQPPNLLRHSPAPERSS